jgi:dual specificity phosphatase 12
MAMRYFQDLHFIPSSSIHAARSSRSLTERHISHIISVGNDPIPAELPESGITFLRIPVEDEDTADLLIHFPAACQFIDHALQARGTVLVHCLQGLSRSAAVVAAYR